MGRSTIWLIFRFLSPFDGDAGPNTGGPRPDPERSTWHVEPVKVFDNLYFVGEKDYSAWAVNTSDGIILIDTIWHYSVADEVEGGLRKLGRLLVWLVKYGHVDLLAQRLPARVSGLGVVVEQHRPVGTGGGLHQRRAGDRRSHMPQPTHMP